MEDDKQKETGEEETKEDAGTDELVDAAPVVESPCHREQLASVSRGLLLLLLRYGSGRKVRREFASTGGGRKRPAGVADPRREGVRSVPSCFASGVLRGLASGREERSDGPFVLSFFQCVLLDILRGKN